MTKVEELIKHIIPELHIRISKIEQALKYLERDIADVKKSSGENFTSLREDISKLQDKILELSRELSETKGQYKNIEDAVFARIENNLLKMALNNQVKKLPDKS